MPINGAVDQIRELSEQLAWMDFELTALCERVGDLFTEGRSSVPAARPAQSDVEGAG